MIVSFNAQDRRQCCLTSDRARGNPLHMHGLPLFFSPLSSRRGTFMPVGDGCHASFDLFHLIPACAIVSRFQYCRLTIGGLLATVLTAARAQAEGARQLAHKIAPTAQQNPASQAFSSQVALTSLPSHFFLLTSSFPTCPPTFPPPSPLSSSPANPLTLTFLALHHLILFHSFNCFAILPILSPG